MGKLQLLSTTKEELEKLRDEHSQLLSRADELAKQVNKNNRVLTEKIAEGYVTLKQFRTNIIERYLVCKTRISSTPHLVVWRKMALKSRPP